MRFKLAESIACVFGLLLAAAVSAGPASAEEPKWHLQATPNPAGSNWSWLNGVSCFSATNCMAVGAYESASDRHMLAMKWDGSAWQIQPSPSLAGMTRAELQAVSCVSATNCIAVGMYEAGPYPRPLVMAWDGSTWQVQSAPSPPGSGYGQLRGVSCTSATACTAVGWYFDGTNVRSMAMAWDGTTWQLQSTPNPPGAQGTILNGVSCTSANACMAVGYFRNNGDNVLSQRWNGTSWNIHWTQGSSSSTATLNGVSCTTSLNAWGCTAVGELDEPNVGRFAQTARKLTLAARWNGLAWAIQSTPVLDTGGSLNGVSCAPSASACMAVGGFFQNDFRTLAERWDGATWSVQETPLLPRTQSSLRAVSCPSANTCVAVGRSIKENSVSSNTLAEHYH